MFEKKDPVEQPQPPLEVPLEALSEEALSGVIDNFILREGTDYGVHEVSLDTKTQQIRKQLSSGDVKIVFDPQTETVSLVTRQQWNTLNKEKKS